MAAPKLSAQLAAALASSGRDPATVSADAGAAAVVAAGATGTTELPAAGATGASGTDVTNALGATGTVVAAAGATGASGATGVDATAAAAAVIANGGTGGGAPAVTAAAAEAQGNDLTVYLQNELRTERERLNTLTVELNAAKSTVTQLSAINPGLETVVRTACERLAIGLGAATSGIAALGGQPLIDMYNTLNADLNKKFPVGQRSEAAAVASTSADGKVVQLTSHTAAIAATSLPKRN